MCSCNFTQQVTGFFRVCFSWYSVKTGTKACANVPSANKRRKKVRNFIGEEKHICTCPGPIKLATTTSRTRPNTRDINVIALTIRPDFNNFLNKRPQTHIELIRWYISKNRFRLCHTAVIAARIAPHITRVGSKIAKAGWINLSLWWIFNHSHWQSD